MKFIPRIVFFSLPKLVLHNKLHQAKMCWVRVIKLLTCESEQNGPTILKGTYNVDVSRIPFLQNPVLWVFNEANNLGKISCFPMYKYTVNIFLTELVRPFKDEPLNTATIWKITRALPFIKQCMIYQDNQLAYYAINHESNKRHCLL